MNSDTTVSAATRFAAAVEGFVTGGRSAREAMHLAQRNDAEGAAAYRLTGIGVDLTDEPEEALPVLSLSAHDGENFDQLVARYATEKNVSLRDAIHQVGRARPDLAASR